MNREKRTSMEDTWKTAELRKHIREETSSEEHVRKREDSHRTHRRGDTVERRHRETSEKRHDKSRTDGSGDKDRNRREERDRDKGGHKDRDGREERDRREGKDRERRDRERREDRDIREERDRREGKDRERREERDRDRREERERDKRDERNRDGKEERDRDRREERDRDRREERDRDRRKEKDRERREERERDRDRREERDRDKREERDRDGRKEKDRERREERERDRDRERRKERHRLKEHIRTSRDQTEREKDKLKDRDRHDRGERDNRIIKEMEERDREQEKERKRKDRERLDGQERETRRNEDRNRESRSEGKTRRHEEVKGARVGKHERDERRHRDEEDEDTAGRRRHMVDRDGHDQRQKNLDEEERRPDGDGEDRRWRDEGMRDRRREERHERTDRAPGRKEHQKNRTKAEADDEDEDHPDHQYEEYEDDFEDYEDDFEDLDPSGNESDTEVQRREEVTAEKRREIEAIQRAMDQENQRAGDALPPRTDTGHQWSKGVMMSSAEPENQGPAPQPGRFIDFVAAKRREVNERVSTKQKKRSAELLRLMELDFSLTASLLELPPVDEYDWYMRTFGNNNTTQAYVQCHEDSTDREVQTEEVEVEEKWTQQPTELCGSSGDPNLCQDAEDQNPKELNFDAQRLATFMSWASQVVLILLEDDQAERSSLRSVQSQSHRLSFSDGAVRLHTQLPFLCGRSVSLVQFSQVQRHVMMSVHMPTVQPSAVRLDSYTIICIWNIWEPSRPQKVLVYESKVACCCFSPGKALLVCAGTSVGSVVLWDLREPAANHDTLKIGDQEWTFRQPTFSTDAVMSGSGHFSTVVSLEVVPSSAAVGALWSPSEEGSSFQLTSMDEGGLLNFWVVLELPKANNAGSSTDLGLRPGGRVKLLHSSSLHTAERCSPKDAVGTQNLQLKFLPSDSNHFFIGTNLGLVRHGTNHDLKTSPKVYRFQETGLRPVDVTSIQFSPFRPDLFLVGCSDGCVRLHTVSQEQPVSQWRSSTAGRAVVSLNWSPTRSSLFCVLDSASVLYIWDLMMKDTEPVVTERLSADRATSMTVFGDSGTRNTFSGLALVYQSGDIELQYFSRTWSVSTAAEEAKLENFIRDLV